MAKIKPTIADTITKQLPDFIREDYQTFAVFIQAYYKYLSQNTVDVSDIRDLDKTLDKFVENFKNEFDYNGARYPDAEEKFILKRIKDIYLSKGSEESYKLLFRLLYNKEAEIYYPGDSILRPSDGKWRQDTSVFLEIKSGDVYESVGKEIEIITSLRKTKNLISRVRITPYNNLVEVFLEKPIFGVIPDGTILQSDDFAGEVRQTVASYKILKPGSGFKRGQIFDLETNFGTGTKIKIVSIDENGGILVPQIIKFGYGYTTDFTLTFDAQSEEIAEFEPFKDSTDGFVDSGYLINPNHFEPGYIDDTYIGTIIREFYNESKRNIDSTDDQALIEFYLSGKLRYPGYYETNDGFLSDSIYLQDSRYYQIFSYVIKVDEQISQYKDFIKRYIHPAGLALFGEYTINNKISLKTSVKFILNFFRLSFVDSAAATDLISILQTKGFSENINISDSALVALLKYYSDEFQIDDEAKIELGKGFSESISADDVISVLLIFLRDFEDTQAVEDALNKVIEKGLAETSPVVDSLIRLIEKSLEEEVTSADVKALTFGTSFQEQVTIVDVINIFYTFVKDIADTTIIGEAHYKFISKSFTESTEILELFDKVLTKNLTETLSLAESNSYNLNKVMTESVEVTDTIEMLFVTYKQFLETVTSQDFFDTFLLSKEISDAVFIAEQLYLTMNTTKYIWDNQIIEDTGGTMSKNGYVEPGYWSNSYSQGYTTFT